MKRLKTLLETLCVAFSLYSRLPMPQIQWTPSNMRYALWALPLIGVVAGLVMSLWNGVALRLGLVAPLRAAGLALAPVSS